MNQERLVVIPGLRRAKPLELIAHYYYFFFSDFGARTPPFYCMPGVNRINYFQDHYAGEIEKLKLAAYFWWLA